MGSAPRSTCCGRGCSFRSPGIAITLALWLVLRLFDARPLWAKIAAALIFSLPVALVLAQANQLIFADVQTIVYKRIEVSQGQARDSNGDLLGDMPLDARRAAPIEHAKPVLASTWQDIIEIAFGRYFMMLAWCALYLALLTGEKARAAERREGAFRRAAKAAELRCLRYQVNPHFLFNTLNSLSALVLTGKTAAAERMIQTISTFYRRSLADDPTTDVPLREEFALQKLYLDIEAVRFPAPAAARTTSCPNELEDAQVPGLILQPLVENSVKHAVAPSPRGSRSRWRQGGIRPAGGDRVRRRRRRGARGDGRATASASASPTCATGSKRASAASQVVSGPIPDRLCHRAPPADRDARTRGMMTVRATAPCAR